MVLGPVSTDALNRAARATYGAVTGLTQTVRNFGGSLGLAVLGSILITENGLARGEDVAAGRRAQGARRNDRARDLRRRARLGAGMAAGVARRTALTHQIQLDFAHSTQTVVYGMAGAMALAFIVALRAMPGGRARAGRGRRPRRRRPATTPRHRRQHARAAPPTGARARLALEQLRRGPASRSGGSDRRLVAATLRRRRGRLRRSTALRHEQAGDEAHDEKAGRHHERLGEAGDRGLSVRRVRGDERRRELTAERAAERAHDRVHAGRHARLRRSTPTG